MESELSSHKHQQRLSSRQYICNYNNEKQVKPVLYSQEVASKGAI